MSQNFVEVRIEGADAANRILKDLDFAIRRRILSSAVRAGANECKKDARALAPVDTGTLKKQLSVSVSMLKDGKGTVRGKVRPKRTKAQTRKGAKNAKRYLHLVVGGTRPHEIKAKPGSALVTAFGQPLSRVQHPGTIPRPFLDQAASSSYRRSIIAFTLQMDKRIAIETAKLRVTQA